MLMLKVMKIQQGWASTRGGRGTLLKLEGEKSLAYSMYLQITLSWSTSGKQPMFRVINAA